MARYIAIIDYADGMYGAHFPDAPGCTAMGETEDEVIGNATDALSEWALDELADGRDLPSPRSFAELLDASEHEPDHGGMISTIPLILETGKVARANISIDAGLLTEIDRAANRAGITRSAFLASAARDRIKNLSPKY